MSKYIYIKYKTKYPNNIQEKLTKLTEYLCPGDIHSSNQVFQTKHCDNAFIAIQNSFQEYEDNGYLLIGQITSNIEKYKEINNPIPDGSFSFLRFNNKSIEFFNDKFSSRTLWFYFDNEKIIVSNSQRAIVSLKRTFSLNQKTSSWFLSSGSQGPFLSWDKEIRMVRSCVKYKLDIINWNLEESPINYDSSPRNYNKHSDFESVFVEKIRQAFKQITNDFTSNEIVLPLSGGRDSRLLLYVSELDQELSKIDTINWGKKENIAFDDKAASEIVAKVYKRKYINKYLPTNIDNYTNYLTKFVKLSECRIDHFNAYTDNFELWKDLYIRGYKIVVRGDIPFTEGLDLNNKMSRSHIGINLFQDFENYKDFNLDNTLTYQNEKIESLEKGKNESLIEWRDRLYVEFRIPIVISAFSDLINGYVETRSPMMSNELFTIYSNLSDRKKGNKNHIVQITKKMDKSNVSFNAVPSIPNQRGIFQNEKGIKFLLSYLEGIEGEHIDNKLIINIINKLHSIKLHPRNNSPSAREEFKNFLSENLPKRVKAFMKSKFNKLLLNPITLAYRIVMLDLALKMYKEDSELFIY